jgi:proline iminopeptidase
VHGRYDVVCPLVSAYDLAARWPEAELCVVPDAGHAAFEPGIAAELVRATASLMRDIH